MFESTNAFPIKAWAEDDRPREKMLTKGRQSLSDAELIAIIIGSGSREDSAVELARKILNEAANSLHELGKLSVAELMRFKGIGEAKAISIAAALELGRRRKDSEVPLKQKITTSKQAADIFLNELNDLPHEEFWVLLLNRSNAIIKKELVSRGGVSGTVVDARLIFKPAIENLASGIILCHNHPSGNLKPSNEDTLLTKKVQEAGKVMDIAVIDHLIIAGNTYFSFADEGIL